MKELWTQLQNIWKQMDTTRRITVGVILFLILGSIIFIVVWANRPQYQLLYSSLNESDQNEIISKLDEMKVPYRTTPGGGIEVPNALSVRAGLLKAGIPHGGVVGWEIFDQNSFNATDFTNQINRQRAIAGELTRTLKNFDGIVDAKIMLNLPDSSEYIFADDKPEGTASVQLQLREQGILSESQAEAIANLVAASTGIKAENVTILDNYANDLTALLRSKRGNKAGAATTSQMFDAKTQYETDLEKAIEGMLTRVFGFNKAVVRVNAELDLDYSEVKTETYGDQGVPRSEQEKTETTKGGDGTAAGAPGTSSNVPQYDAAAAGPTQYSTEKSDHTVNYEINKTEELRIAAPGKVKRQTVGVWVDGNLPYSVKTKVENTVAAAAGIMPERGDKLTVETIKFTLPPAEPKPPVNIPWQQIILYLILAMFLGGLLLVIKKFIPKQEEEEIEVPATQEYVPETIGSKLDEVVGEKVQQEQQVAATVELPPEEKARMERLATLEKVAMEKPEEVAALLKNWLSEDY